MSDQERIAELEAEVEALKADLEKHEAEPTLSEQLEDAPDPAKVRELAERVHGEGR